MTSPSRRILKLSAIWSLWVWVVLIRNMVGDYTHGLSFRLVHIGLAIVSLGFAVATWRIARGRDETEWPEA